MSSLLIRRTTLLWFSFALLVSGALDLASTMYAIHPAGGWDGEANPVFRGLGGTKSSDEVAVILLLGIKMTAVCLVILWLTLVMRRIPELYPSFKRELGLFRFGNLIFYGRDVPWWKTLFGVPSFKRLFLVLSVPAAVALVVSGVAASVTNTFGLLHFSFAVVMFWAAMGGAGALLGIEFLRRDFLRLSHHVVSQQGDAADPEAG